jgi:hypothetical protein
VAGTAAALALVVQWPAAARLFHFEAPSLAAQAAAALAGLSLLALSDIAKRLRAHAPPR